MHFKVLIIAVYGDLNKDGIEDVAIVTQDTIHKNAPYRLEVFFRQVNNDLKLIVSTTIAIPPEFPYGKEQHIWGYGFDELSINKGVLWIHTGFIRGHEEHKFRFQNGQFELIGFSYTNVEGSTLSIIDYNLSTGRRIEKEGLISDDDWPIVLDTIIKLNSLPTLAEFDPNTFLLQDISLFVKTQLNFVATIPINEKYSIGFCDSMGDGYYCDAYIFENAIATKLMWSENIDAPLCDYTRYSNTSPNGRYTILENITHGFVEDGETKEYYENFTCLLVDLEEKNIKAQFQGACGGEWTENNEWLYGEDILFKPE